MDNKHRLKIKIGAAEFEAEGDPELVKAQFEAFLKAIPEASAIVPAPAAPLPPAAPVGANPAAPAPGNLDQDLLGRVFAQGDPLSLTALPRTDNANPDALLVLLYGYHKIRGEATVTGTMLMKSAKKSGVPVERVDRSLGSNEQYVNAAGAKKGRRYSLNNRGLAQAEAVIRGMVE